MLGRNFFCEFRSQASHDKLRSIPTQVTNFIQSNRFPRTFGEASGCRYFPSRFSWKPTKRCATTKTEEAIADRNNINAIPACPHDLRLGPSVWREKGGGFSSNREKSCVRNTAIPLIFAKGCLFTVTVLLSCGPLGHLSLFLLLICTKNEA